MGNGTLRINASDPDKGIEYDLSFGELQSRGAVAFEAANGTTTVAWTVEGELGTNPLTRYFALLMDRFMGPDLEEGLSKLKRLVEGGE